MIIAVDAGKYQTKAMNQDQRFCMRTKLDTQGLMLNRDGKTFDVEYKGTKYVIGDDAQTVDYDISKTKLVHQVSTFVAVANLTQSKEIDLVVGCPVTQFINKETRQKHADYFKGNVQIKVNGTNINFSISSVTVLPETFGVVMSNTNDFLNSAIGIIDIGGLNSSGVVYSHMKPIKSSAFSINEGGLITNAKIKRALNTALMTNYQNYQIPCLKLDNKTRPIVDDVLNQQMHRILEECKQYNWDITTLPIIFTGGGSLMLEKQIRSLNFAISKDCVWDNAKGFLKFKEMYK